MEEAAEAPLAEAAAAAAASFTCMLDLISQESYPANMDMADSQWPDPFVHMQLHLQVLHRMTILLLLQLRVCKAAQCPLVSSLLLDEADRGLYTFRSAPQ